MRRRIAIVLIAFLMLPAVPFAQRPGADDRIRQNTNRLSPARDGAPLSETVLLEATRLVQTAHTASSWHQTPSATASKGHPVRKGALIGAAAGAGGFLAINTAACGEHFESNCSAAGAAYLSLLFGGIGAAIGSLIAAARQ